MEETRGSIGRSARGERARQDPSTAHRRALPLKTVLLLCTAVICECGCAKTPNIQPQYVVVDGVCLSGVVLGVHVGVYNPNSQSATVEHIHADPVIADRIRLPSIDLNAKIHVRSKAWTNAAFPVRVPWSVLPGVTLAAMGPGLRYRVSGSVRVNPDAWYIPRDTISFSQNGRIPQQELMIIAAKSAAYQRLPWCGM